MVERPPAEDTEAAVLARLAKAYASALRKDIASAANGPVTFLIAMVPVDRPGRIRIATDAADEELPSLLRYLLKSVEAGKNAHVERFDREDD